MKLEIELWLFVSLTALSVLTGFVDAVAGGGGLIMMPSLLAAGIPPANALATNKLQSLFGIGMSCRNFLRAGLIDWKAHWLAVVTVFLGAVIGVLSIQQLSAETLSLIIPILLIGVAAYIVFSPRMDDSDSHERMSAKAFAGPTGAIGLYDGFFGPGAGSFLIAAGVALRGLGLTRATALSKLLNFSSNVAAVLVWGLSGKTYWALGLAMAAGAMTGNYIGSHTAIRFGAKLIRPALIVVSLALTAKLLWDYFAA
ncbi:TSUP family transporter [Altericroceibacterium endophyticum]|uniref:Probable membrane transporter protein n=1 Tax=Altericroceibacterium endophyticum TaxID=1808508 RepID=A0A6I4T3E2_9SPHN|nr:TSUP family transporter [Altericroceibacterium endophyticum]MXO64613.1 TSUP family transporter [Altericroceibacterium endophyticum]